MVASGNVGLAFGLVCAAGFSTCIGALLVFIIRRPRIVYLAVSLGLAAGVMIYVAFVEILSKGAVENFQKGGVSPLWAFNFSQICFFGGFVALLALEAVVNLMLWCGTCIAARKAKVAAAQAPMEPQGPMDEGMEAKDVDVEEGGDPNARMLTGGPTSDKPQEEDTTKQGLTDEHELQEEEQTHDDKRKSKHKKKLKVPTLPPAEFMITAEQADFRKTLFMADKDAADLERMGFLTALAMFIHNFPEGVITFIATLAGGVKMGVSLTIAVALHNIPEGICVAMPIYYSSGNRWKAFFWAIIPAIAEPIGGLFAFLVLDGTDQYIAYAIVFGLVAGMMVCIALKELLSTALRLDPHNRVTFWSCVVGMLIMAFSLGLLADNNP